MDVVPNERKQMKKFRIYNDNARTATTAKGAKGTKTETKNVSVKIPGDLYAKFVSIKEKGGFKSVYEILQLLIVCYTRHVERTEQEPQTELQQPDPMADEIAAMFADLADVEPTPEAGARPKIHKPRKRILYE